ncbi:MAG: trigger factor [Oscillospiraceae bacterium]|jgi:trigger factor|nr:trigger factor [Oscillospiraceae bacterium]
MATKKEATTEVVPGTEAAENGFTAADAEIIEVDAEIISELEDDSDDNEPSVFTDEDVTLGEPEKLEHNHVALSFVLKAELFQDYVTKAYQANRSRIIVPGFRKGKAPRKMMEKIYGESLFWEEAINNVIPQALRYIVNKNDYKLCLPPVCDAANVNPDNGKLELLFDLPLFPEPEIENYKGLKAVRREAVVDDAEIDLRIETLRSRNASLHPCDRPAQLGDTLVIDYKGFVDDRAFDGGEAKDHSLELGSNSFVAGFEAQLIGAKTGDTVDVNVTFPSDYHAKTLRDKAALFKVTVSEVKELVLPELDDEFAKDVSEFDTLEEYRASLVDELAESAKAKARDEFLNDILDQVDAVTTVDIDPKMIEEHRAYLFSQQAARYGIPGGAVQDLLKAQTAETREEMYKNAEHHLRGELILEKISRLEGIEVTDEDRSREYGKLAEDYGVDSESVKTFVNREAFEQGVLLTKVADYLIGLSIETEPEPESETETESKS